MKDWLRHGKGTYTWVSQKMRYQGNWKNNNRHGYGEYKEGNSIYTGNWKDDKRWGKGKITINKQHSILKIKLQNFRSYKEIELDFTHDHVVLYGPNGSGKTNFLEAISLLSPGRGLRNSKFSEMVKDDNMLPWGVNFEILSITRS